MWSKTLFSIFVSQNRNSFFSFHSCHFHQDIQFSSSHFLFMGLHFLLMLIIFTFLFMGSHFLFMFIIFRLYYFNVTFQEVFSTLSTASTSGSVRLRTENFWILVFVILKSENGKFPFPIFFFFKNKNPHKSKNIFKSAFFNGVRL